MGVHLDGECALKQNAPQEETCPKNGCASSSCAPQEGVCLKTERTSKARASSQGMCEQGWHLKRQGNCAIR